MLGRIISDAVSVFPETDIADMHGFYSEVISLCSDIFRGEPPWKTVKRSGLYGQGEREISRLNAAKVLCDQFADMTFGQQVDIIIGDKDKQRFVDRVLQENAFWDRMPQFFSRAYALGGGAVRVFAADGRIRLDYIGAESFIPVGWSGRGADEGIFRSIIRRNGKYYTLFERHGHDEGENIVVSNRLFVSDRESEIGERIPVEQVYKGLGEEIVYPYKTSMFAYFHPSAANNLLDNGCLGLSVFYNCMDTHKALDIAFDSFSREFILGRKRIIVPSSCIRTVVDPETGNVRRYFDADDEVYQALRCDDEKELKIIDNTAELRVDEHVSAINALLNILCFQTGLSSGTLSFGSASGVRTAAEIESQENRTQRTMQANRNIAAEFIEGIVRAIIAAGSLTGDTDGSEADIRISFSKELDINVDSRIDRNIKLVEAGLRTEERAIQDIDEVFGS